MKCLITNEQINDISNDAVFVFGSNLAGRHGAGAARQALLSFGAIYGQGIGLQGQSYALPTLDENFHKLPIERIEQEIKTLKALVEQRQDLHFLITKIGTGLASFRIEEIAPLFRGFEELENVSLPQEFLDFVQ